MALAVIISLALVPVHQSAAFSLSVCAYEDHQIDFRQGTTVSGSWNEPDGSIVSFFVGESGSVYYDESATNGSFSFTVSDIGPVDFVVSAATTGPGCTVANVPVSVHWSSPILWQLSGPD